MKTLIASINEALLKPYQHIFVIIKPGFLDKAQTIINIFNKNGWEVDKTLIKTLLPSEAKELYAIHKEEEWYEPLWKYMSSGPSRAFIFKKPGKTTKTTFTSVETIKDAIRKKYGESDMRNVLHSSDSQEHMNTEMHIYF